MFGIVSGHVETCHSYTNDQNLIDNYHKTSRRGRSAPLNMVITETGAAKAVAKVIAGAGRQTDRQRHPRADAQRLAGDPQPDPGPGRSRREQVNEYLRDMSLDSPLHNQIDYTNSPEVVSSDFVGSRHAGVVDSLATIVQGNRCVLYVWYDNEFGYSCQVHRVLERMAGIRFAVYPKLALRPRR